MFNYVNCSYVRRGRSGERLLKSCHTCARYGQPIGPCSSSLSWHGSGIPWRTFAISWSAIGASLVMIWSAWPLWRESTFVRFLIFTSHWIPGTHARARTYARIENARTTRDPDRPCNASPPLPLRSLQALYGNPGTPKAIHVLEYSNVFRRLHCISLHDTG